jgi:hypothetical protein
LGSAWTSQAGNELERFPGFGRCLFPSLLYMVLRGSLFSTFSLDLDSYGMVMGAGAVLLAIGTMFLFRKWVKFVG